MGINDTQFEVQITLNDVKPAIWRDIIINSTITLPDFHKVIQTVIGWTNSHLHQFRVGDIAYSIPDEDSLMTCIDYKGVLLSTVLKKEGDKIYYDYDYGDGWEHTIVLNKIISSSSNKKPLCIDGERSCPPEDCGGPFGYNDLVKVLSNQKGKKYKELIEWLGEEFDPEYFDKEAINELLKKKNYGCESFD